MRRHPRCADLRCSVQAFDAVGGEALGGLKSRAIRLQRHLPREPLMIMFQTAKLRRGAQMFRATRSSASNRQIITILQQVLSSERPINHQRGARCRPQIGAAVKACAFNKLASADLKATQIVLAMLRELEALADGAADPAAFTEADQEIIQRIQARLRNENR